MKSSTTGCSQFRDHLTQAVRARLKSMTGNVSSPAPSDLLPEDLAIVAPVAPYASAEQAVAAELDIDWFDLQQAPRQCACRVGFAALELQYYLRRITGQQKNFPIAPTPIAGKCSLLVRLSTDSRAQDGSFEIAQADGNYLFTGSSIQGPLYAVYEYLQQLGCSFLRPGRENEYVPHLQKLTAPQPTRQQPSFRIRRLHDYRKNRATPQLLDWMAKARINLWGSDNLLPGMRIRGIALSSGMHDVLPVVGLDHDFCICNPEHEKKLLEGLIEAYAAGPWKNADVADYIGADWGQRCSCAQCQKIGNPTDIELFILGRIRRALHQAYRQGRLNRDLPVMGYSYFDCEHPPSRPLEKDFDHDHIAVEFWVMRCWEHFLDEKRCDQDFPMISKMHDFLGRRFDLPGNHTIHQRLLAWLSPDSSFRGEFGVGYYLSNAGNYWLPLCQLAILCHEIPYLHALGVQRLGYMHISTNDWGPKAAVNLLYARLAWNAASDPVELLARYFLHSFGPHAAPMAEVYFDLERALANVFNIKRFFIRGVDSFGFETLRRHSHVNLADEPDKTVPSFTRMYTWAAAALQRARQLAANDHNPFIAEDLRWLQYAAETVNLYRIVADALDHQQHGHPDTDRQCLLDADQVIAQLKNLNLDICLPEKVQVNCAEASGIVNLLGKLADELHVDLSSTKKQPIVQTSIEPVQATYLSDQQVNPIRWYPDPDWPITPDGDEIGLTVVELIQTDVKHMGVVAQRIAGQTILASVGDDLHSHLSKVAQWHVLDGSSVVCFTGAGQRLWKHDLNQKGLRVNIGPWPAFVDLTGKGDWAVSVFAIYDGGPGRRQGHLYLYDALTGRLLWRHQIPDHDYPGGNGSCVAADLDNDGRIEIVYGLCNCVLCVDALTGAPKWTFDENIIKICHGRLALCDVNDDGRPEIVVATEYGDDKNNPRNNRSSILTLDGRGRLLRRMSNITGDLGSTPIVVADVDGDGLPEIIHGSENLCFHEPRHMAELFVRERYLIDKLDPVPVGGARFAVGDIDGDGRPEAVGVTSYRDGGPLVKPEIYCVRVSDGKVKWKRPLSRFWFDGDTIMADVDGDGRLEALVTAQYSSGYMQQPGISPWGDLYVVKADGRIIYKKTFPDAVFSPIALDADLDGKVEIVVGCYDGKVYLLKTPAPACDADWPLVCQNAQRTGVYPNHQPA